MNEVTDPLLAPEDAAVILGPPGKPAALATLQWWRYKGRGPKYVKIGRHVYYRESALREFIQRGEVEASEATYG
jgi:hypothetical protein